jgi:hypothetical protein
VVSSARTNLNVGESQVFEEFITEFQEILATKSDDYGRTDRVYHRIDTETANYFRRRYGTRDILTRRSDYRPRKAEGCRGDRRQRISTT